MRKVWKGSLRADCEIGFCPKAEGSHERFLSRDNDGKEQEVKICISVPTKILNKVILTIKGLGSLVKYLAQKKFLIKLATIVVVVAIVIREVILLRKCLISLGLFQLGTSLWLFFNGIIFVIIINR